MKSNLDVYSKGACSSIKSIFEENIAVKKGLKPDPNAPQVTTYDFSLLEGINPDFQILS
jgi:hypothetical protein